MTDTNTPEPDDRPVEVNQVQARQGVELGRMRWVLAFGLIGVVVAFLIVLAIWV